MFAAEIRRKRIEGMRSFSLYIGDLFLAVYGWMTLRAGSAPIGCRDSFASGLPHLDRDFRLATLRCQ